MSRRPRIVPGGFAYHVMNRAAGRRVLFDHPSEYQGFEDILSAGQRRTPMRIIAYCLMANHWHLLLWPEHDGAVSIFMHWVATTHARRWVLRHDAIGRGAVYQSRFKSVVVQTDEHLLTVWRYIERNPVRAGLVPRAEFWPWSSLCQRSHHLLSIPPMPRPGDWLDRVNRAQSDSEVMAVRQSLDTGAPLGDLTWCTNLGFVTGWRPHGRPRRKSPPVQP